MASRAGAIRIWMALAAATLAIVVLCVLYLDRPIAEEANAHFFRTAWQSRANDFLNALVAIMVVVFGGSFAAGFWRLLDRPLPAWTRVPLLCAWSIAWALASTEILKRLVGRSSAAYVYFGRHLYEFRWLRGSQGFDSFPSGTMAVAAACLAVIWCEWPRTRALCVTMTCLIAAALVMTSSHWVGDLVGGLFLGATIGWLIVVMKGRIA